MEEAASRNDAETRTPLRALLKRLREDIDQICDDLSLKKDGAEGSGYAFARWYAGLFMETDPFLQADLDDVVLRGPKDLGIDAVLTDDTNRMQIVIQAKFRGYGTEKKPVDPTDVDAFLKKPDQLASRTIVERGNPQIRELLCSYGERLAQNWRIRFEFVTTGIASEELKGRVAAENERQSSLGQSIEFHLVDREALPQVLARSQSLELSIPDVIELALGKDQMLVFEEGPYRTVFGLIKGNAIADLYNRNTVREALFALNIRNYLGDRSINREIKETASKHPDKFFYFNNGITAVCKEFTVVGNKVTARKLQVINGAQTVGSLARAPRDERIFVPFRLIETRETSTDSGINSEIISANNTQNPIRISDFRSNDPIQRWLEKSIQELPAFEVLGRVAYKRKRTSKRVQAQRVIELEELAKVRYSFYYEPTLVHADPKALWTSSTQSDIRGVYEKAFGLEGELYDYWPKDKLFETLFAVAVHDRVKALAQEEEERSKGDELPLSFRRLRFHALALVGLQVRSRVGFPSPKELLGNRRRFEEIVGGMWRLIRDVLFEQHKSVQRGEATMFSLVRNDVVWKEMQESVRFKLRDPTVSSERPL